MSAPFTQERLAETLLAKIAELNHEIERARRRINSPQEADRAAYIETFIAGYEREIAYWQALYAHCRGTTLVAGNDDDPARRQ
jgi:hypothetical protein